MVNSTLLDSKTVNLNEIFSNGKAYRIPQFQRDYSWEEDNWKIYGLAIRKDDIERNARVPK